MRFTDDIHLDVAIRTLSWFRQQIQFITRQRFDEALETVLMHLQPHLDSHYTLYVSREIDRAGSNKYMARRVQHFLPSAEPPETGAYIDIRDDFPSISYVRQDRLSKRFYKILVLDEGSYWGSQAQSIIRRIRREMDWYKVPLSAKIQVIYAYVACSKAAEIAIRDQASQDTRIELVLVPGPIRIMSIRETIESRGGTLEEDLNRFQISFRDLNAWTAAVFRHGQWPSGADMYPLSENIRKSWEFPSGADMYATVLPHKLPDDASLLWSKILREG
jgi:hypothetical protein